jgi:hypothetical protein
MAPPDTRRPRTSRLTDHGSGYRHIQPLQADAASSWRTGAPVTHNVPLTEIQDSNYAGTSDAGRARDLRHERKRDHDTGPSIRSMRIDGEPQRPVDGMSAHPINGFPAGDADPYR